MDKTENCVYNTFHTADHSSAVSSDLLHRSFVSLGSERILVVIYFIQAADRSSIFIQKIE